MNKQMGIANTKIFITVLVALAVGIGIFAVTQLDTTGEKGSGLGQAYEYDIEELAKIDPNLILYEESAEAISTGFKAARAIAVDFEKGIFVAGDKVIRVFAESGDLIDEVKLTDSPRCLTVTDDGKIYVGMRDHVEVYDGGGKRLARWESLGADAVLTSIAVSKNDVFVANAGSKIVVHYDSTGKLLNYIGKKDKDRNIAGFHIPSPYFDLAVGGDGLLRVADTGRQRIEAYTFDGDLEFSWGKGSVKLEDFTPCCNPVNFAILDNGSFVTCEKGLIRVKIYDADGTFVGVVAGPEQLVEGGTCRICYFPAQCQKGGFDVAVDAEGRIFVLDTIKNVVRIFSRKKTS
ncbi:MAG: NHL repeat-containing protein [Planctomycetota bacterium]|jgi:hypothetical protein